MLAGLYLCCHEIYEAHEVRQGEDHVDVQTSQVNALICKLCLGREIMTKRSS